jgi:hypothetical protein
LDNVSKERSKKYVYKLKENWNNRLKELLKFFTIALERFIDRLSSLL